MKTFNEKFSLKIFKKILKMKTFNEKFSLKIFKKILIIERIKNYLNKTIF